MSCDFDTDLIDAFAAGVLDAKDKQRVAAHYATCETCRASVQRQRNAIHLLDGAFNDDPPDWLVQKTLAHVKHRAEKQPAWQFWLKVAPAVSIVAVVAVLAGFSGLFSGHRWSLAPSVAVVTAPVAQPSTRSAPSAPSRRKTIAILDENLPAQKSMPVPAETALPEKQSESVRTILGLIFENPVNDRSIYRELGVNNEIAALLL